MTLLFLTIVLIVRGPITYGNWVVPRLVRDGSGGFFIDESEYISSDVYSLLFFSFLKKENYSFRYRIKGVSQVTPLEIHLIVGTPLP